MEWTFKLELKRKPKLDNPVLIEGLPGIGNVGKIAADYIIEKLKMKKLYTIHSHHLPHSVFVNENNLIEMPKLEVYYKRNQDPKKRDLLILSGDTQPIDEASCYSFCHKMLQIVSEYNCNEVITLGGIGLKELPEKPQIYISGTSKEIVDKYKTKKTNDKLFGHVGPIIGVTGILLAISKLRKKEAITILGETFAHPMHHGIFAAKEILTFLNKKFKLNINFKHIDEDIKEMEEQLKIVDELEMVNSGERDLEKINYIG